MNLLAESGQVDYLAGDDDRIVIDHNAFSPTSPAWLKVHANNTDGFEHTINATIIIGYTEPE